MVIIGGDLGLSGTRLEVVVVVGQKLQEWTHVLRLVVYGLGQVLLVLTIAFHFADHLKRLHFSEVRLQQGQELVELKVILLGSEASLQLGV